MSDDDDNDNVNDDTADYSVPDPFITAIELCRIASSPKTIATALKRLRRVGRDIDVAEKKLAAVEVQAAQTKAALAEREAELDAREAALDVRATEFESSLKDAHDHLREFYNNIAQEDRRLRYRVLSYTDLLSGYNPALQDLPEWPVIKQMVPDLPDDLPAPVAEVISQENVREDWSGNVFTPGSTLTRTIRGEA